MALAKGRMDVEGCRKLVANILPEVARPVYAIDTSTYMRSDAETNPEHGVYYHASRHSAGKLVVAGACSLVASRRRTLLTLNPGVESSLNGSNQ